MTDTNATVVSEASAERFYEGPELCREYFRNDHFWFGTSVVEPGDIGGLDPGHDGFWEVFYCAQGEAIVDDGSRWHVLKVGDALTIPSGVPHTIHNRGTERVVIVWSGGPEGIPA